MVDFYTTYTHARACVGTCVKTEKLVHTNVDDVESNFIINLNIKTTKIRTSEEKSKNNESRINKRHIYFVRFVDTHNDKLSERS